MPAEMLLLSGIPCYARVVESADSPASGAGALHGRGGSSPPSRTNNYPRFRKEIGDFHLKVAVYSLTHSSGLEFI